MNAEHEQALARLLADLRREGRQQSGLDPRLTPPDRATAYRVAGMVAEELGWPVIGWKIAATNAAMQDALRTDQPIYGRVFAPNEAASPATVVLSPSLVLRRRKDVGSSREKMAESAPLVKSVRSPETG